MENYPKQGTANKFDLFLRKLKDSITIGAIIIIIGSLVSYKALEEIKKNQNEILETQLTVILKSVYASLHQWSKDRKNEVNRWVTNKNLNKCINLFTEKLQDQKNKPEDQANLECFQELDEWIDKHEEYQEWAIITKNGVILRAGHSKFKEKHEIYAMNEYRAKVFAKEISISLPTLSNIPLPNRRLEGKMVLKQPTMFVASVITNEYKETPLAMIFRIDPEQGFTKINQEGRIGKSGETYAFNKKGYIISASRFGDTLINELGFIAPGQSEILSIQIRSPGIGASKGFSQDPYKGKPLTYMAENVLKTGMASAEERDASSHKKNKQKKFIKNFEGYPDYRGVPVIGMGLWNEDFKMGITTELDFEEAYSLYDSFVELIWGIWIFTIIFFVYYSVESIKHKAWAKKLVDANSLLNSILNGTSSISIVSTDLQGLVRSWNKGAENQLGYTATEMVGRENIGIVYADKNGGSSLKTSVQDVLKEKRICHKEVEQQTKEGKKIHVALTLTPKINEDKEVEGIIGIGEDITETVQGREKLKINARYLKLVEEILSATIDIDNIEEMSKKICDEVRSCMKWAVGNFFLLDRKSESFTLTASSFPTDSTSLTTFVRLRETNTNSPGMRFLKQVVKVKLPVYSNNLIEESDFEKKILMDSGLQSGFWFPIFIEDDVVGILEFLSFETEEHKDHEKELLQVINKISYILGRAIERKKIKIDLERYSMLAASFKGIIDAMNKASTSEEIIQACLDQICSTAEWEVGHYLIVDENSSANEMSSSDIWYFDDPDSFKVFRKVSRESNFRHPEDLPVKVLASKQPIWIENLAKEHEFQRGQIAKNNGLKSGFCFPILKEERVFGVMEFYFSKTQEIDKTFLDTLGQIGVELGNLPQFFKEENPT